MKVGAFYNKAMVIADLSERVAFLNRGQGWVVRKLRQILPRVRDDRLHADFAEMLQSHEANIAPANGVMTARRRLARRRVHTRDGRANRAHGAENQAVRL